MDDKIKMRLQEMKEERRREIIQANTEAIVKKIHRQSLKLNKILTGKKRWGIPIVDAMDRFGKILPTRTDLEQIDSSFALAFAGAPVQKNLDDQLDILNKKLIDNRKNPVFSALRKEEAQRIVNLATSAYRGGISGFEFGDPLLDAYQNGNLREPMTPGQHIHPLSLSPHKELSD